MTTTTETKGSGMDKQTIDNFKSIADYVNIILRYMASGAICFLIWIFLYDQDRITRLTQLANYEKLVVGGSAVIGFLIYAVHRAYLDRIFYKLSISIYIKRNGIPEPIYKKYKMEPEIERRALEKVNVLSKLKCVLFHTFHRKGKDAIEENYTDQNVNKPENTCNYCSRRNVIEIIYFELYTQGYLREATNEKILAVLYDKMEMRYAILAFLYCSFYSCIVLSIIHFAMMSYHRMHDLGEKCIQLNESYRYIAVFAIGIILAFVCAKYSYRLLKREIWILREFWQDKPGEPAKK